MANKINELYDNFITNTYHVGNMIKSNPEHPQYAVFKQTWNSHRTDKKSDFAHEIMYEVSTAGTAKSCTIFKEGDIYEDKESAKGHLATERWMNQQERSRDWRYSNYKDSFLIHACDSKGNFLPTLSDIKNAVKYYYENKEDILYSILNDNTNRNLDLIRAILEKLTK